MIILQGIAKFHLDCKEFDQVFTVQCDVPCGLNDEGQPDVIGPITPKLVTLTVGGMDVMQDQTMAEMYGKPKAFIERACAALGLEGVGITDAQVAEALQGVEDWAAHEREHAVGRI